jgi:predicted ATPase
MVIVEQPEVHLHPRLQAETGDLFIESVQAGKNQLLVETHSEHLVLRVLRRIREGTFDPTDLAILYVDLHQDGAAFVRKLEVDSGGEIVDNWPGSFFDDRLGEVLPGLAEL